MTTPYLVVDAFTSHPFAGNPAAVCPLSSPASNEWMQSVAAEMNLSETAFLLPLNQGFSLRWFTPRIEVDLCGHATLASAHALWELGRIPHNATAVFHTRSGVLTADRSGEWIELDFPADPPLETAPPPGLSEALGVAPSNIVQVRKHRFALLAELASEELVRNLQPDMQAIQGWDSLGIIVTSRPEVQEYDFISRFFAPKAGIPEDPVTGAAHCCLGPYWGERLGKNSFLAYQASARGGEVRVENRADRVVLGGKAVTVARGELLG